MLRNLLSLSSRFWVHIVMSYVFSSWTCYSLYKEYKVIAEMRLRFLAAERRRPDQFTVSWSHFDWDPFAASLLFMIKEKKTLRDSVPKFLHFWCSSSYKYILLPIWRELLLMFMGVYLIWTCCDSICYFVADLPITMVFLWPVLISLKYPWIGESNIWLNMFYLVIQRRQFS